MTAMIVAKIPPRMTLHPKPDNVFVIKANDELRAAMAILPAAKIPPVLYYSNHSAWPRERRPISAGFQSFVLKVGFMREFA